MSALEGIVKVTDCFGSIKTSAEFAYRRLEQMIVMSELSPGSQTTEAELQHKVGVGRTPVREAIQRLAWEGLLEIRPRAGVAVAPLKGDDWVRIMEIRRNVELVLARAAADQIEDDAKRTLSAAIELMIQACDAGDLPGYAAADKLFDMGMAEASRNCHVVRAAIPLQTHTRRFWIHFHGQEEIRNALTGHIALAEAVMDKDVGRAVRQARHLMSYVRGRAENAVHRLGVA
ncbi:GntR family transcriptional regulator [Chelativorans sp. ZYF759]|uniref:GntR family transcriptional regulator n=1 Tax=Chelativorans sp. ZYF759 TaxID=2692213 RepID=UPI00145DFDA5|nr:GntR family transcriptional regulator [Chelativorans sp. ZYF759]NMG38137.1 GntR family transcriptional regulator [Chelativorans sp. ZYF759]